MRKAIAWLLVLFMLAMSAALCGCAPTIDHGTVTAKDFAAEHTDRIVQPLVHSDGSTTMLILPRYVPDVWSILIDCDEPDVSEWWTVDQQTYETVQVGDIVIRLDDGSLDIEHPPD